MRDSEKQKFLPVDSSAVPTAIHGLTQKLSRACDKSRRHAGASWMASVINSKTMCFQSARRTLFYYQTSSDIKAPLSRRELYWERFCSIFLIAPHSSLPLEQAALLPDKNLLQSEAHKAFDFSWSFPESSDELQLGKCTIIPYRATVVGHVYASTEAVISAESLKAITEKQWHWSRTSFSVGDYEDRARGSTAGREHPCA